MKTLYHLLTLVMGLILFVSCDKESEVLQNPEEKILKIQVTDKGYASDPANKETKAIDEEFNTTFENGDKIGVFIVDEDGSITYANVPVTLKDNVWVDETQGVRIKSTTEKVFAYYPYVEDSKINDLVSPEAESESDFFAGYINSQDISDQSTLSRYRQADVLGCMVEKASISEGTITFNMSHLMGLVVLDFNVKQMIDFTLESDPDYTWRRTLPVSVNVQLNNGELMVKQGETLAYYYLVNPNEVQTLNGEISKDNEVQSFVLSELPTASLCKSYLVTATLQTIGKDTHKLQIGDIFKSDGGLISQAELANPGITEEEKAECVGIVFSIENPYVQDNSLDSKFNHGLVMALKDASKNVTWGGVNTDEELKDCSTIDNCREDLAGFSNCQYFWTKYIDILSSYPALNAAKNYSYSLPEGKTNGWFIPSIGQWIEILANLAGKSFKKESLEKITISGNNIIIYDAAYSASEAVDSYFDNIGELYVDKISYSGSNILYWSSTELNRNNMRVVAFYGGSDLYVGYDDKPNSNRLRCITAF